MITSQSGETTRAGFQAKGRPVSQSGKFLTTKARTEPRDRRSGVRWVQDQMSPQKDLVSNVGDVIGGDADIGYLCDGYCETEP